MAANNENITAKVKRLGTVEALSADPRLSAHLRNLYPLTGRAGTTRKTKATLGEGTYGRVNLEELNEGNVATKYFLSEETMCENISEIAILKYLQDVPNVAQLIRVDPRPAALAIDEIAPSIAENMSFPAMVMGKAIGTLDAIEYSSWDKVYSTIVQILQGYYMLHSLGIVHRDTKPQNMLMTATWGVWITDFGMAKYHDKNIPRIENTYTGTVLYSAPELLMNDLLDNLHDDYYKSDAWAVGATIFQVLTGKPFNYKHSYKGYSIENMIDSIFTLKGDPTPADGNEFYTLYQEYTHLYGSSPHATITNNLSKRIRSEALFKPDDSALFEKIIYVVDGLLTYNPEKRMSIKEALESFIPLPVVPPRPRLLGEYIVPTPITPITNMHIDILFNWLHNVVLVGKKFTGKMKAILLDRAGVYTMEFLNKYHGTPYVNMKHFQLIGIVGLYIASCLFDLDSIDINYVSYITAKAFTKVQVQECIKLYMVADIDFYGRTFLDEMLDTIPDIQAADIETYGLLNYICFQKNIFPSFVGREEMLKRKIARFLQGGGMETRRYLSEHTYFFKLGDGKDTHPKIVSFLASLTTEGGRQPAKTKKQKRVSRRNRSRL